MKQHGKKARIKRVAAAREIDHLVVSGGTPALQASVSITCSVADASGALGVEMSYEGDPATVLYLLESAIEKISDEAFPQSDECEEYPTIPLLPRERGNNIW